MLRIFCILLLCLTFVACDRNGHNGGISTPTPATSPTPEQPPIALFLLDATSSLNDAEHKQVAGLATEILKVLPHASQYGMYPIQIESARVPAIIPDDVVDTLTDVELEEYDKKRLPKLEKELIDNLEKVYKTGERIADDKRSCIINMLWFAEDRLKQMSGAAALNSNKTYRLVVISDMVEECGSSPLGEVRLNKQNIAEEIKLADNFTQITSPPNLSNVHVTVIFPLAQQSPIELSRRPADRDLRAFWKKIFNHCQVKDEYLEWIPTGQLPNWYKRLEQQKRAMKET